MDKGALEELAARCEAATNAIDIDRLNGDILRALGWTSDYREIYDPSGDRASGVPAYTTSLDAAMTLVPEGLRWAVYTWSGEAEATVAKIDDQTGYYVGEEGLARAATPALALCAAALRARVVTGRE